MEVHVAFFFNQSHPDCQQYLSLKDQCNFYESIRFQQVQNGNKMVADRAGSKKNMGNNPDEWNLSELNFNNNTETNEVNLINNKIDSVLHEMNQIRTKMRHMGLIVTAQITNEIFTIINENMKLMGYGNTSLTNGLPRDSHDINYNTHLLRMCYHRDSSKTILSSFQTHPFLVEFSRHPVQN